MGNIFLCFHKKKLAMHDQLNITNFMNENMNEC